MFPRTTLATRAEDGFTLVELMIALAILAIIINAVVMVIYQLYNVGFARTNHIIAVREVQNASHWLALDGQKAATLQLSGDADGFPLTISWNSTDGSQYQVVYTILPDNELQRQHYTNRAINPNPDNTTIAARFIDPSRTSCNVSAGNELTVNITTAVDIYHGAYSETRTYRFFPRRNLTS